MSFGHHQSNQDHWMVIEIDCVNRKLAIKFFQVPILSQQNSFLVVIHNRGSPCVIKFFCALVQQMQLMF